MDNKLHHFDKDDKNVTDIRNGAGETSSFIENHEEKDYTTLNFNNEFQSNNQDNFSEDPVQTFDAKLEFCVEANTVEIPTPTSNPTVEQNQTLDQDEHAHKSHGTIKNDAAFQQAEYQRSPRLVRLQAVSGSPLKHRPDSSCDITVSNTGNGHNLVGDSSNEIQENKMQDGAGDQQIVFSEDECRFLSSEIHTSHHPIYLSSNPEENVLISEVSYQPVMQSEDTNTFNISNTSYEQIAFSTSDTTVSNLSMPRIEKVQSSTSDASMWIVNSSERGDKSGNSGNTNDVLSDYQSPANSDETPDTQQMQRFLTADNQVVYGYKDSNGEFHFFCPAMSERESHNEKERKRRSRVSDACSSLRKVIPGMSEKTDKATVFEQAARYLKFLRDKFGTQFDQAYCEKYYQEKS